MAKALKRAQAKLAARRAGLESGSFREEGSSKRRSSGGYRRPGSMNMKKQG